MLSEGERRWWSQCLYFEIHTERLYSLFCCYCLYVPTVLSSFATFLHLSVEVVGVVLTLFVVPGQQLL